MRYLPAILLALLLAVPLEQAAATAVPGAPPESAGSRSVSVAGESTGERIYREGVLPSGQPLRGEREADISISGTGAACVTCHRRSGYGAAEGQIRIPPITGHVLFQKRGKYALSTQAGPGYTPGREAYTDETLARAIREGVAPTGRTLSYLMPRYALDDEAVASLIGYLKGLSTGVAPGVTGDTLRFATIVTPDADPAARQGMLDVLKHFIEDKDGFLKGGLKPMARNAEIYYRVQRRWQLDLWELNGAPETWEAQLERKLAEQPVFAVLSGLGGGDWAPVERFCEKSRLPCLFPNVDLPVRKEGDFYTVYFSRGVLLEAQLVAADLAGRADLRDVRRLIQVYRQGDVGEQAARALASAAALTGIESVSRVVATGESATDATAGLRDLTPGDAVMLWLREPDLSALTAAVKPPQVPALFVSGLMAGMEDAPLATEWRGSVRMAYPMDLPERRKVRMTQPLTWFKIHNIPLVSERVQADTYLACGIVAEALSEMLDTFQRDIVLERLEFMLNSRLFTGDYARLGLAQGQRFASKGGYIARFADASGTRLVAEGGYTVP